MTSLRWILVDLQPILLLFLLAVVSNSNVSATAGFFQVTHKFAGQQPSLNDLKAHDRRRHQRILYGVDLPLGGDGKATGTGLYYTKIGIGSPPNDYYVHVDTGSDIFWVNCIECKRCPKKSGLGVKLRLYNPSSSTTGNVIPCDQEFCTANFEGPTCTNTRRCEYILTYGDGSSTAGYFVKDNVQYDRVTGNLSTTSAGSSVVFGCGVQQTGNLDESDAALDGIIGFGQAPTSMISQMALSGSVTKIFAHCLDGTKGGGIFAMGRVVQPQVNRTPIVPNEQHYNVNLEAIEVGKDTLQLPKGVLGSANGKETIIDSGTTLAYLPDEVYQPLITKILANHGDLDVRTVEDHFQCFEYNASVDDGFPTVSLNFEGSLQLVVYPHDYLFKLEGDAYCIGWQSSGTQSKDVQDMTLLGDLVLTNKLVVYDLVNQEIGWTEYNCSSTIGLQDEQSNITYQVGAHNLMPSAGGHSQDSNTRSSITLMLLLCVVFHMLSYYNYNIF